MKKIIALVLSLILMSATWGQRCLSDMMLAQKMAESPVVQARRAAIEANRTTGEHAVSFRNVVTLQVVVHVVYHNALENISDLQIQSQINALNEDFRLQNANAGIVTLPEFANVMADLEIEFQLADTDPWGQPTNGITRTATTESTIGIAVAPDGRRRICYTELGGQDAWCPEHYINIWVGKFPPGIAGEGSYPGEDEPEEDGIRIDPSRFGRTGLAVAPFNLGRTLTHEMGHFFDLPHIFGSVGSCEMDDGFEDTPTQKDPYLGCPFGWSYNSCNSKDMYVNYMDYTDDACMAMFTNEQKNRVRSILEGARAGLLMPGSCGPVDTQEHSPNWFSGRVFPNPSKGIIYLDLPFGNENEYYVDLYDLAGRLVQERYNFHAGTHAIDLGQLENGIYFIKITKGENSIIVKLIVIA